MRIPITDNHAHINPIKGLGLRALQEFGKYGGCNIILVNLLCKHYGLPSAPESFRRAYQLHLNFIQRAREKVPGIKVYAVIGPHPAEITEAIRRGIALVAVEKWLKMAIDEAVRIAINNELVIALGEVGRPHYPVSKEVWKASNRILKYAFRRAASKPLPIQIHMEEPNYNNLHEIVEMAEEEGFPTSKIIIHHAPPLLELAKKFKVIFSITAKTRFVEKCLRSSNNFLLETDYLDDPRRPGAVLSLRSIPRVLRKLFREGKLSFEQIWKINVELPEDVYGVSFH